MLSANEKRDNFRKDISSTLYKPILAILLFCGIDMLPEDKKPLWRFFRIIIATFNGILCAATVAIGIDMFAMVETISVEQLSTSCLVFLGVAFKLLLYHKRKDIFDLIQLLKSFEVSEESARRIRSYKNRIIALMAIMLISFSALYIDTAIKARRDNSNLTSYLERLDIGGYTDIYLVACTKLRILIPTINNMYPFHLFTILYSALARHLEVLMHECLQGVKRPISTSSFCRLFATYSKLYRVVQKVDEVLRTLVFVGILSVSSLIYFTLFSLLKARITFFSQTGTLALFGLVLAEVFLMIDSAAEIPDMNVEIHNAVLGLSHDASTSSDKMFLALKTQQQIGLSLGGLALMRRGVFLTLVGTIFTYCLLVKSFP